MSFVRWSRARQMWFLVFVCACLFAGFLLLVPNLTWAQYWRIIVAAVIALVPESAGACQLTLACSAPATCEAWTFWGAEGVAGTAAALSSLSLILPAVILARRLGWSWPSWCTRPAARRLG